MEKKNTYVLTLQGDYSHRNENKAAFEGVLKDTQFRHK